MSNGGVMLTGWLRKSPPERKLRRNAWKKRWFVLRSGRLSGDPNVLEYFRHQGSKKPIRAISLDECSQIDANVPIKYERKDPNQQHVFDIVTKTRTYYLVADTSLEMASWVRYLCDLCGFNHDSPENQDLGSQQQTFKAVQPGRSYPPGATEPLLNASNGTPVGTEVPMPLPRPQMTITKHSVPISSDPVDANGNFRHQEKNLVEGSTSGTSSAGSGHVSVAETPNNNRKYESEGKNGYSFAVEPSTSQPPTSAEYVLLTECKTASALEGPLDADPSKLGERRASTDSVFTHDGAISDCPSDAIIEQPMALRYFQGGKKTRLDSMPDCPPPPPPNKVGVGRYPPISRLEEQGYSFPPEEDDEDHVQEARERPLKSPNYNLPPIDDREINRVPLNLQRAHHVDEMGIPLADAPLRLSSGSNASSSRYAMEQMSGGGGIEYINTADASSEVGIGNYPGAHASSRFNQHFPVPGMPFLSPINRSNTAQMSSSSVFFANDSTYSNPRSQPQQQHQLYDVPKRSPINSGLYSSPRHANRFNSKNSLHSSTNTLTNPQSHGSPQRANNVLPFVPNNGLPRIRRSSSVGQLEVVANELAAKTSEQSAPTHHRRRSIDHSRANNVHNTPSTPQSIDMGVYSTPNSFPYGRTRPKTPPPRPPKSEATVKQLINDNNWATPSGYQPAELPDPLQPQPQLSPVHTAVISTEIPDSPPHTQLIFANNEDVEDDHRPAEGDCPEYSNAGRSGVDALQPATTMTSSSRAVSNPTEVVSRSISSSCSSSSGATSTDTSRSRSPVVIYDFPKPQPRVQSGQSEQPSGRLPEVNDPSNLYDTPRPRASPSDGNLSASRLAEIEDSKHPSYEPMMNQPEPIMLERIDDISQYTTMASATSIINQSPISSLSKSPSPHLRSLPSSGHEPPPVKRDLKPGRRSLGSDGGSSDVRPFHSRMTSGEESTSSGDVGSPNSHALSSDVVPVSPSHVVLMHKQPSPSLTPRGFVPSQTTTAAHSLFPPERPPKISQSSLSPRTPPSASMARPYNAAYNQEWFHKPESAGPNPSNHRYKVPGVPGRPPKPINMLSNVPRDDNAFITQRPPQRPRKKFPNDLESPHFGSVPPAPGQPEKELKYVELTGFSPPESHGMDPVSSVQERPQKTDGVQYIVIDQTKTQAIHILKKEREKEKEQIMHKRPVEGKSGKTLK